MAKYNHYTEYVCECGEPAAPQSNSTRRKDGTLAPRVSTLTKKPCCAKCLNNGVAEKNGFSDYTQQRLNTIKKLGFNNMLEYDDHIAKEQGYNSSAHKLDIIARREGFLNNTHKTNEFIYRGLKYSNPICINHLGKLGFRCYTSKTLYRKARLLLEWVKKGLKNRHTIEDFNYEKFKLYVDGIHALNVMQVDHIDGNSDNNEIENLQVICPMCHGRKTLENGDNLTEGREEKKRKMAGKPKKRRKNKEMHNINNSVLTPFEDF